MNEPGRELTSDDIIVEPDLGMPIIPTRVIAEVSIR
jgi:hypothetical protein